MVHYLREIQHRNLHHIHIILRSIATSYLPLCDLLAPDDVYCHCTLNRACTGKPFVPENPSSKRRIAACSRCAKQDEMA